MQQEFLQQQNKQTAAFLFHLAGTHPCKATQEISNGFDNSTQIQELGTKGRGKITTEQNAMITC